MNRKRVTTSLCILFGLAIVTGCTSYLCAGPTTTKLITGAVLHMSSMLLWYTGLIVTVSVLSKIKDKISAAVIGIAGIVMGTIQNNTYTNQWGEWLRTLNPTESHQEIMSALEQCTIVYIALGLLVGLLLSRLFK